MFNPLSATTAGLACMMATAVLAQSSGVDQFKVEVNLMRPQNRIPGRVAESLQGAMKGVGCPDWRREDGQWGPSTAGQFEQYLRKTGQVRRYETMKNPTVASIKDTLFKNWSAYKDFSFSIKTDPDYCDPSAQAEIVMVDLDQNAADNTELPGGLPPAIAFQFQRLLRDVGCPAWLGADGVWGTASAEQFNEFLVKTGQLKKYDREYRRNKRVDQIEKGLFDEWGPRHDFEPANNSDSTYCEPVKHAGEEDAKATRIDGDLRAPQPPTKLYPDVARQLQRLLMNTGCPDWGGTDGKWGPSSSTQFTRFLKKTGQEGKYIALRNASLYDVKAFFSGWVSRPDFDESRNDKPQYCEPVAKCNLNNEIRRILNESSENFAIRDLYRSIYAWNMDVPRQKNIQGRIVSEQDEDILNIARDKLMDAETALRDLFRQVVETRYPDTCGLCTIKKNYERAKLVDAPPLEGLTTEIIVKYQTLWKDVEALQLGILQKRELRKTKLRSAVEREKLLLTKEGGPRKEEGALSKEEIRLAAQAAELRKLIEADRKIADELKEQYEEDERFLNERLKPVRKDTEDTSKIISDDFRELMFLTTCFVGDDIYAKE
jgi:hypothetical protein